MVAINPHARPLPLRAPKPVRGRYERAPYLLDCLQLSDELVAASGMRDFVLPADGAEPPDPTPAEERRLQQAIAECCRSIRAARPEGDTRTGRVSQVHVEQVQRMLALKAFANKAIAKTVGVSVDTVLKIARGQFRLRSSQKETVAVRCPGCGGKLAVAGNCALCAVRRVPPATPAE